MSAATPIPPDREGRSTLLHRFFVVSAMLGEIPPLKLLPSWLALVAIACWPWGRLRVAAAFVAAFWLAADWVMLALLPRCGRSWGPVTPPLLGLTLLRTLLSWGMAWLRGDDVGLALLVVGEAAVAAAAFYATWIEPFALTITRQRLALWDSGKVRPLRLLHISDVHYEGDSPREAKLLDAVRRLAPDLIVLTGDYLNLSSIHDAAAREGARRLLAALDAPLGVFAITGSPPVDIPAVIPSLFADLDRITWLEDRARPLEWEGRRFWLVGVRCTTNCRRDGAMMRRLVAQVPEGEPVILLHHSPDLMPEAAEAGVRLYLAGHTHGGQIRLPLFGALATSSRFGKRYEMGLYRQGRTVLYVSRGLGVEGVGAPRARFLAPPEIILWALTGGEG